VVVRARYRALASPEPASSAAASVSRPSGPVGIGEVVAGGECFWVLWAEDPLLIGEQWLVDRDRLPDAPGVPVGASEVVACREGLSVLSAENPLLLSKERLEACNCL
jgi:hypothetical protein